MKNIYLSPAAAGLIQVMVKRLSSGEDSRQRLTANRTSDAAWDEIRHSSAYALGLVPTQYYPTGVAVESAA